MIFTGRTEETKGLVMMNDDVENLILFVALLAVLLPFVMAFIVMDD